MNRIPTTMCGVIILIVMFAALPRLSRADDWLPVLPEDLALKDNPKQPGADAMVFYREVSVDAKPSRVENYLRIKVFTSSGVKKRADIEIPYDRSQESIENLRARTIRPDGSIVQFDGKPFDKEIVKGNGIKYLAKTFTMPDVQPGSIIEYRYREQYDPDTYQNFYWTIQSELFTRLARFSTRWDDTPGAPGFGIRTYAMPAGSNPQKVKDRYVLEVHDLPGIEEETLMPPDAALKAAVDFYYRDRSEPSQETVDQYWKRIGKSWSEGVNRFVDKKKELAAELSQDVSNSDSPDAKLRKLYARTLKIRNLDMEDSKTEKEEQVEKLKPNFNVGDVLNHNYGHGVEINYLLIGLARAAGFEAADVRVAALYSRPFFPQRQAFYDLNDELVWVRAGGKEYYLDPASRYYPFGVLPWYESAASGIRATKDGSEMIMTTPLASSDAEITRHADFTVDNDLEMNGKIQVDFSGLQGASRRLDNRDEDEAGRRKVLGDEIKQWLAVDTTFEVTSIANWDQLDAPLHVEGTFKSSSTAHGAVQRIMLPLELFQATEIGLFQSQSRVNEVDFPYPYQVSDDLVIHCPLGYKALAVPDPQKLNPGPLSYEISAVAQPDRVEIKRLLAVKGIRYPKESYPGLRNFFSKVKTDDSAPLMLQSGR
ncbi:MAG TPA: DUF3857 domain-containing protein [Candidatus Acidoferrales bacterium]